MSFNIDNLKNVVVQMKIPMAFDVLDSFTNEDEGKPYFVVVDNIPAKIHFKRIYDFRYKNDIGEKFFKDRRDFYKIKEDRNTLLSYMEVQVWFDNKMFNSEKIDKSKITLFPDQFIEASLPFLNKFINTYVSITGQFWLRRLIKRDIMSYQYLLINSDNYTQQIMSPFDGEHIVEFNSKPFKLDNSLDTQLRNHLENGEYSWINDMVSIANNNYKLGMYNIALTQLAILFENYVYTNLNKKLSNTKLKKIKKKEECGCLVGISEICTRGIKEYFSYDFGATKEWDNIKNHLLKYRNKIVHGEQIEEISEAIYLDALKAQQQGIKKLSENVF